jgi:hypothetical protein
MNVIGNIIDADADIAALVYSNYDRPDLVLCAFADAASCRAIIFENGRRAGGGNEASMAGEGVTERVV